MQAYLTLSSLKLEIIHGLPKRMLPFKSAVIMLLPENDLIYFKT
jgi:hypothetical protein